MITQLFRILLVKGFLLRTIKCFLSNDTYVWYEEALKSLDHQENPVASEFLPQVRHFLVSTWYRQLRIKTQDHIESDTAPILSLAPKPNTAVYVDWLRHGPPLKYLCGWLSISVAAYPARFSAFGYSKNAIALSTRLS